MIYLLDANIFIEAKNRYYGLDFCPAFWDWLIRKNKAGIVFSLDKVYDELQKGGDELSKWANGNKQIFIPPHKDAVHQASQLSNWVQNRMPPYSPEAKNEFLSGNADYWLIAHAIAAKNCVVTHEILSKSLKRIKIPDVCHEFNLDCISSFEMLRSESAKFTL